MVELLSRSRDSENDRAVLLKYYTSELIVHGLYAVSIAIWLLVLFVVFSIFGSVPVTGRVILLGLVSSVWLTLGIHILGRTLFFGCLAYSVLFVIPKRESETRLEEGTSATSLLLLHRACVDYVRRKQRIVGEFHSARIWEVELWLILFVVLSLVWFNFNI